MTRQGKPARTELKRLLADKLVWWAFRLDPGRFAEPDAVGRYCEGCGRPVAAVLDGEMKMGRDGHVDLMDPARPIFSCHYCRLQREAESITGAES